MHQVLVALALTSVTPAGKLDSDSGGGSVRYYTDAPLADPFGKWAPADEFPHIYFQRRYDDAETDTQRAAVFRAAKDTLDWIRRSRADRGAHETWEELLERVALLAGLPAKEVAVRTRTGITTVRKARRALGVDLDYGRPRAPAADSLDARQRREQVRARHADGMSVRSIAFSLGLSKSTVHRDLGHGSSDET